MYKCRKRHAGRPLHYHYRRKEWQTQAAIPGNVYKVSARTCRIFVSAAHTALLKMRRLFICSWQTAYASRDLVMQRMDILPLCNKQVSHATERVVMPHAGRKFNDLLWNLTCQSQCRSVVNVRSSSLGISFSPPNVARAAAKNGCIVDTGSQPCPHTLLFQFSTVSKCLLVT